jgi:hypothetical protein
VRGTGYLRDLPDRRDYDAEKKFTADRPRASVDMSPFVDRVRDQLGTGSCVGQAIARAAHIRAALLSRPIPFPSALAIYANARSYPLIDEGCRPRDAMRGIQDYGLVSEDVWPFEESRVDITLPWDVVQSGSGAKLEGYYRLWTQGEALAMSVRVALSNGYPVIFGQDVDDDFYNYTGGILGAFRGPSQGGHMTTLIGYDETSFLAVNSWGDQWGMGGFYRVSAERLTDPNVSSDFYAIELPPESLAA